MPAGCLTFVSYSFSNRLQSSAPANNSSQQESAGVSVSNYDIRVVNAPHYLSIHTTSFIASLQSTIIIFLSINSV